MRSSILSVWTILAGTALAAGAAEPDVAAAIGPIAPATWQAASAAPLRPGEIDQVIDRALSRAGLAPAPLTTDEQFIRRVTLDLIGQLPLPADVDEFVADATPDKRGRLVDQLLSSEEFARHWGRYWREVISSRLPDRRGLTLARPFEDWMAEQIRANTAWDQVAIAMVTADGQARFDQANTAGPAFFLLSRTGNDAVIERTAETARIFMGIQIQCAQCHDHPFDQWKREQFHELAGYFARLRERPLRDGARIVGLELVSLTGGEHQMPGKDDPRSGTTVHPRFLDGKAPDRNLADRARRQALAGAIVARDNPWFAAAYVNRVWGELMGQAFYQPVDDMGPLKDAVLGDVLVRLSGAFRGTHYDTRALFRAILGSKAYQRQVRLGETLDQHLHFSASYPRRLGADALWQSLTGVLGRMGGPADAPQRGFAGPFAGRAGLEGQFKDEFEIDPSARPDEVEGSIAQALLLMNNPLINQKIRAEGTNLLGRILTAYPHDDDALRTLYLRTLARKPTDREKERALAYIRKTGNRSEAFEDLLWVLINSTEFQTKR